MKRNFFLILDPKGTLIESFAEWFSGPLCALMDSKMIHLFNSFCASQMAYLLDADRKLIGDLILHLYYIVQSNSCNLLTTTVLDLKAWVVPKLFLSGPLILAGLDDQFKRFYCAWAVSFTLVICLPISNRNDLVSQIKMELK